MSALFIKYDFYQMFGDAVKYDNQRLACSIVEDELAKLMTFKRIEVINLLLSKGVKVRKKDTNDKVIKIILDNKNNIDLSRDLIKMIIDNNSKNKTDAIESVKNFNGNGRYTQKELPKLKIKDKEFEDSVLNAYLSVNGDNVKSLTTQHNINKMEIDKSNPAYKKAIVKNTILTASITIGAILLVGGTYLLVKKLKSIPKESKPEATPQPAPVQTQAPQQMDATKMTESNYKPQVPVPQPEA